MSADADVRVYEDRERRTVAKPPVAVATVPTDMADLPRGGVLPPAGAVVVYVGDSAAPQWRQFRDAASRADWQTLRETTFDGSAPEMPNGDGTDLLLRSPVYFDVRCAGRTLVRHAVLPEDVPIRTLLFPYTGGRIDDSDFEVVEYRRSPQTESTAEYLVLVRPPGLTALERQLLESLDPHLREIHIGTRQPCGSLTTMELQGDIFTPAPRTREQVERTGGAVADSVSMTLTDDAVRNVVGSDGEPASSVAELLALRRKLLGQ